MFIVNAARFIVALTFIVSGFVKAVDPQGTQIKLQDYAEALGLLGMIPDWLTLAGSVALSAVEFTVGVLLLFAIHRRITTKLIAMFMAVMTPITTWIFVADPVSDCGCFGDAIVLTNGETLLKNVILLSLAIILMRKPLLMPRFVSLSNQWIVFHFTLLYIVGIALYGLYYLPLFDFRPYHIGANIREGMEIPEGETGPVFDTTFLMEKDGVQKEFTLEEYPDSTWTFIDSKTTMIKEGYVPPIHDFSLQRVDDGEDITDMVLTDEGYTMLLISPHLEQADDTNFGDIDKLFEWADDKGIPFYCMTASTEDAIERWKDLTGAEYQFCNTDETTLKTIIRSNPGLLLLKNGTVVAKWSHNELPDVPMALPDVKKPTEQIIGEIASQRGGLAGAGKVILWFIIPLALLTIADRLWMWSHWLKKKEIQHSNKLFKHLKRKKTMAKKIVAGNWKMNKNLQEGVALAKELTEVVKNPNCDVIIGTPFIHLASVAEVVKGSCIQLSAENCADKASGAYTGEVSAEMVKSTGAQYVILGHSERREYYNETPEILKEKVELALANGLKVIFCIGESLEEREANKQNEVVKAELAGSVFHLDAEQWKNIIIAYEPIWAIGSGKTATADQAEEIHAYIRSCVAEVYGAEAAAETSILYGGSCKASNAPELFAKPDIDGGLIGGASLKAADFKGIIDAWG